jgi:hypothetical protein
MTSPSDDLYVLKGRDLENFGFARVRDIAYDAVQELWRRRKSEGWTQVTLANNLDRDTGWLSRYLRGPGNWTLRTFGAFVQGLHGDVEIRVRALEDVPRSRKNHNPYAEYTLDVKPPALSANPQPATLFGGTPARTTVSNTVLELTR